MIPAAKMTMEEDHLRIMLQQESGVYHCPDYLASEKGQEAEYGNCDINDKSYLLAEMNEVWRRKICEWSYKVVDHFRFDREVVSICLNYLDRFLAFQKCNVHENTAAAGSGRKSFISRGKSHSSVITDDEDDSMQILNLWDQDGMVNSKSFQLAAMTALYVAAKVHAESTDGSSSSKRRKKLNISFFVDLSRGQFAMDHLLEMERKMLMSLNWRVNPPTPMKFVAYLLKMLPEQRIIKDSEGINNQQQHSGDSSDECDGDLVIDERVVHVLYELSRYLTELSVCIYHLNVRHRPSTVAFAAVLISADMIDPHALSPYAREIFLERVEKMTSLHTHHDDVVDAVAQIRAICPEICDGGGAAGPDGAVGNASPTVGQCGEESEEASSGHPISIARDAGFLVSSSSQSSPLSSSPSAKREGDAKINNSNVEIESPTCVSKKNKVSRQRRSSRRYKKHVDHE